MSRQLKKAEVLIVGAGPAGVSAALYAAVRGKKVLLVEKKAVGGLVRDISLVSHFLHTDCGEDGLTFARRMEAQLEAAGIAWVQDEIQSLELDGSLKRLSGRHYDYESPKVILAMGSRPKPLPLNLDEKTRNVVHHAIRGQEADFDKATAFVVGGSDGAAKEAIQIARLAEHVHLIQDQPQLLCVAEFREQLKKLEEEGRLTIHLQAQVEALELDPKGSLKQISWRSKTSTGEEVFSYRAHEQEKLALAVFIGQIPNSEMLAACLELDNGYVLTQADLTTRWPGVYVAGDLRKKISAKLLQLSQMVAKPLFWPVRPSLQMLFEITE